MTVKKDGKCDMEALRKVVKDAGFTITAVKSRVYEFTVVTAGMGKMTLSLKRNDHKHTFDIPKDSKITLDGKEVKLEELKESFTAKVTLDDKFVVKEIVSKSKEK